MYKVSRSRYGKPRCVHTWKSSILKYISPMSRDHNLEKFRVYNAKCVFHKLETFKAKPITYLKSQMLGMYSQTDLSTKKKQLKASIVSDEFYGLSAKCHGPQMSIELGITNNGFKWCMA